MTSMHGPDAVAIMRGRLGFTGCVIAVTGNVLMEDYEIFLNHGADDVLTKPLTNKRFLDMLAKHGVIRL
jgi:CheY-like chemotaxis protein